MFVFCALSVDLFLAKIDFKAVFLRVISFVVVKRQFLIKTLSNPGNSDYSNCLCEVS